MCVCVKEIKTKTERERERDGELLAVCSIGEGGGCRQGVGDALLDRLSQIAKSASSLRGLLPGPAMDGIPGLAFFIILLHLTPTNGLHIASSIGRV